MENSLLENVLELLSEAQQERPTLEGQAELGVGNSSLSWVEDPEKCSRTISIQNIKKKMKLTATQQRIIQKWRIGNVF